MWVCEYCKQEFTVSYGSNRFCCSAHAKKFSAEAAKRKKAFVPITEAVVVRTFTSVIKSVKDQVKETVESALQPGYALILQDSFFLSRGEESEQKHGLESAIRIATSEIAKRHRDANTLKIIYDIKKRMLEEIGVEYYEKEKPDKSQKGRTREDEFSENDLQRMRKRIEEKFKVDFMKWRV